MGAPLQKDASGTHDFGDRTGTIRLTVCAQVVLVLTVVTIVLLLVIGVNIMMGKQWEKTTAMENAHGNPDHFGAPNTPFFTMAVGDDTIIQYTTVTQILYGCTSLFKNII